MLWRAGDVWRVLLDEINSSRRVIAVVTINFTTRLLDVSGRRQVRIPQTRGHRIERDFQWRYLGHVDLATPCGIRTVGHTPDDWHLTTPVLLVAALDMTNLAALNTIFPDDCAWVAPGHPECSCGALYCETDERERPDRISPTTDQPRGS